jgi:DTW domain-containing protein YfiP
MLKNSTLLSFGVKGKPFDARLLQQANTDYYVLYPGPGAVPLDKKILKQGHKKKTFVVLDGTWAQAARMSHRVPFVKDFSFVTFPKKIHTQWGVRQAAEPHRLCTLEAVVHWMEVLYGKKKALPLRRAFKQVRNRHFLTKRRPNPYISQLRQSQSAVV